MTERRNCCIGISTAVILLAVVPGHAKPAHEDKLEHLAEHLQETAFRYESLNVELVGALDVAPEEDLSQEVRTSAGPLKTTDLFVSGDYAYIGSYANRLYIVDISSPEEMRVVAQVETPGPAVDVKVEGDLAIIAVQRAGLRLGLLMVDVSDPRRPRVLAEFSDRSWQGIHNLFLDGDRAYLAPIERSDGVQGIFILDVSQPSEPRISGTWINENARFSNLIHDVFVDGNLAYVSDFFSGLVILDLSDPDRPVTLSSLPFEEGIHSAWAHGGYVYCNQEFGGWERSLHVVDASDPANPVKIGNFRAEGPPADEIVGPHNPFVRDGLVHYAYYDAGLRIFDLADPTAPRQVGFYPTTMAWGAHPHTDGNTYVADSREGLIALRYTGPRPGLSTAVEESRTAEGGPGEFALGQNAPNPFNSFTIINFSLPRRSAVNLAIFNLAGQKVATIVRGEHLEGSHAVGWDGRDDDGRSLASGVYLYRLEGDDGNTRFRKLLLIK